MVVAIGHGRVRMELGVGPLTRITGRGIRPLSYQSLVIP
jgi:hypothetical protein